MTQAHESEPIGGERRLAMVTLGQRVIDELRRRGEYGLYFDEKAYAVLRSIDAEEECGLFMESQGFATAPRTSDAAELVTHLERWQYGSNTFLTSAACGAMATLMLSSRIADKLPSVGMIASLAAMVALVWAGAGMVMNLTVSAPANGRVRERAPRSRGDWILSVLCIGLGATFLVPGTLGTAAKLLFVTMFLTFVLPKLFVLTYRALRRRATLRR